MDRLIEEIARDIREHVKAAAANLYRADGEIRTVFHGPPMELLEPVFERLVVDGGIEAELGNGQPVCVPVLLQVDSLGAARPNPPLGESGRCDAIHLLEARNSPNRCPRFVALVEPGGLSSLSFTSASDDFGLSPHNNSGAASTADWWRDEFVRRLVKGALDRHQWPPGERDDAHDLVELAIQAADQIDKHVASRHAAWRVLARTWSIGEPGTPFGTLLSLACGFPPLEDGTVDVDAQRKVLLALTERLVDSGFKSAFDQLKERADENDIAALDELLLYLQQRCGVPTVFSRAPAFYYGPSDGAKLDPAPGWWKLLTVEKWRHLLDGAEHAAPTGRALRLECHNPLLPSLGSSGPTVVTSNVVLSVHNNGNVNAPSRVTIERKSARSPTQEWEIEVISDAAAGDPGEDPGGSQRLDDTDIPLHSTPVRYSVESPGTKKTTLRVVSMETWEPGLVVFSRTASKIVLPRQPRRKFDNVSLETSLTLTGEGRHYFDIHVRPGVTIGETATGSGDDDLLDLGRTCLVSRASDTAYGFEVVASGDCFYQVEVTQEPGADPEICRIYLACDEVATEDCSSEFERLIRANTRSSRTPTEVHVNRQLRCADLQGWMLAKDQAEHSYRPFVMASDYASHWRSREWSIDRPDETMITSRRFLHDPRPTRPEMAPPHKFVEARGFILGRIRGDDDNGLIEAAPLGEWCVNDPEFAQQVEDYLQAYYEWLESAPESAAWCDVAIVASFESDDATLAQEPDAILVSPFHPVRLAWHCVAQRALYLGQRKSPCPAASILDPDAVPDTLVLPLRTAAGGLKYQPFFSVECSSDYWAILWNGSRLDRLPQASKAPFDKEFGVLLGGISSGFSLSQVTRALDDIAEIFSAKPVLNVSLSSAAGQNNACNEGILEWCRDRFGEVDPSDPLRSMGQRFIQVFDERPASTRPEDAEVSNLAEDTENAVSWMSDTGGTRPDLAIIAQLETSNPQQDKSNSGSPLGPGALIRHRMRQQLGGGNGAFLTESRMSSPRPPTGDGLLDKTAATLVRLENIGGTRYGYTFAPSVHAIRAALDKADYAAVSSSAVDPACFLGGWLQDAYLWDYELPSYSHRAGDNNGYYLLSKVKDLDKEALGSVLSKLPGCASLDSTALEQVILEVARRGIPTVRGLSRGDSGASGDLGLFLAARLIQDDFRLSASPGSLLPVIAQDAADDVQLGLVVPVDPFKGYIEDLGKALSRNSYQRPDLLVAGITISDSKIACRITPIEVKYRGGQDIMPAAERRVALLQARSFSGFLSALRLQGNDPDHLTWKLAFQHLLSSMLGFAMRVYSQRAATSTREPRWSTYHARIMEAVLSDEMELTIDPEGRLVVVDGSPASDALDLDGDGFAETIVLGRMHAGAIVSGIPAPVYALIKSRVGYWRLLPEGASAQPQAPESPTVPPTPLQGQGSERQLTLPMSVDATAPVDVEAHPAPALLPPAPAAAVPALVPTGKGLDLLIGTTLDGFEAGLRRLNLSDTNLNQLNIGVVGDLGTGKTQLLKSLVYQVVSSAAQNRGIRPRFLIFDYKKDYSSADFVQAVNARVVKPQHLPINLFDVAGAGNSMAPWLDRFKFFADVLDKIFSGVGPVQRQNLKTAVKKAYEDGQAVRRQPTIYDVHAQYRGIIGNKTDAPFSIIDDLVDMEMFSRESTGSDAFDKFLDGVVVISLDALGQDDRTKNMLVAIMLNIFYEHMLRIPKRPFTGSSPQHRVVDSFLLVDEADNIMRYEFDVLRKILLQGREFGVGVVLASQYLRHFKAGATDYREPLLTWLIHKVPNITPQELGALGLVGDMVGISERIKTLPIHTCLFKTFDVPGDVVRGTPFYEITRPMENGKE